MNKKQLDESQRINLIEKIVLTTGQINFRASGAFSLLISHAALMDMEEIGGLGQDKIHNAACEGFEHILTEAQSKLMEVYELLTDFLHGADAVDELDEALTEPFISVVNDFVPDAMNN